MAAGYGYNVAEHQAEKSYVFDLDENGDVWNCTVTSGGGKLIGPTEEEQRQFEAEQTKKRKRRVKYIRILKENAEKRKLQEQENLLFYQSQFSKRDLFRGQLGGKVPKNLDRIGKEVNL